MPTDSPNAVPTVPVLGTGGGGTGEPSGAGGSATGGRFNTNGGESSGGTADGEATGGQPPASPAGSEVFPECRFHFGVIDSFARNDSQLAQQVDYFTPGWMGLRDTFDQEGVCEDVRPGGPLAGKVPVIVAYVAAFYAKRQLNLNDCNVGEPDLCQHGAQAIQQNLSAILGVYDSYARGYANCYGTERPIIFAMEPDYYQYTEERQTDPMSPSEAGQIMAQFVGAIRTHLPNALFSLDISPWVGPNNGEDHGAEWFSNFDMSLFTFVSTSGGGTDAASERIRASNNMTWAGVHQASGKPILADTGYGVNGSSAGHDPAWDDPANIDARMADGVVGVAQYNPKSGWGATLSGMRDQLSTPATCP
jgi:hypothetical protein